jgi:hypothetical protein
MGISRIADTERPDHQNRGTRSAEMVSISRLAPCNQDVQQGKVQEGLEDRPPLAQ